MNDLTNTLICDRSDQLISFLYGETNEQESREFQSHLRACKACQTETASFGKLRESLGEWKDETVSCLASPRLTPVLIREKSALAALREFFDLSPLWLKGVVGFATVLLAVMLVQALYPTQPKTSPEVVSGVKYTQNQVDQIVKNALDTQAATLANAEEKDTEDEPVEPGPISPAPRRKTPRTVKPRPSLSRAEREQLATDLRLLKTDDETSLNLLGDRINQEF